MSVFREGEEEDAARKTHHDDAIVPETRMRVYASRELRTYCLVGNNKTPLRNNKTPLIINSAFSAASSLLASSCQWMLGLQHDSALLGWLAGWLTDWLLVSPSTGPFEL